MLTKSDKQHIDDRFIEGLQKFRRQLLEDLDGYFQAEHENTNTKFAEVFGRLQAIEENGTVATYQRTNSDN